MKKFVVFMAFISLSLLSFSQSKKSAAKGLNSIAHSPVKHDSVSHPASPDSIALGAVVTFIKVDTLAGAVTIIQRSLSGPVLKTYQSFELDSMFSVTQPNISQDRSHIIYTREVGKKTRGIMAVTDQGSVFIDLTKWYQFIPSNMIQ